MRLDRSWALHTYEDMMYPLPHRGVHVVQYSASRLHYSEEGGFHVLWRKKLLQSLIIHNIVTQ